MKKKAYEDKVKPIFYRRTKEYDFLPSDIVLKWDARREDERKYGKFDNIWF